MVRDLTNKSKNSRNMENKTTISVFSQLKAKPLIYAIEKKLINHHFDILFKNPVQSGKSLLDGEVDFGIIPVTTYAKTKETWRIIPDISLACSGQAKDVHLFFRKGLQDIKEIAVDDRADATFDLLKIMMREKFNLNPNYKIMKPDFNAMLSKADAALIIGDEALHEQQTNKSSLDLGEEWYDFTGLPFISAFCAGRQMTAQKEDIQTLKIAFELGNKNLERIAKEYAKNSTFGWSFYHDFLTYNVSYSFSELEQAGLNEFYNYAFFYGLIDYIPELHFFEFT